MSVEFQRKCTDRGEEGASLGEVVLDYSGSLSLYADLPAESSQYGTPWPTIDYTNQEPSYSDLD